MARRLQTTAWFNIKVSEIYIYVRSNRGSRIADNFVEKLYNRLSQIQDYPGFGRPSGKKPYYRRVLVGKQNILYYSVNKKSITLHHMLSAYGDPNKNPYG